VSIVRGVVVRGVVAVVLVPVHVGHRASW